MDARSLTGGSISSFGYLGTNHANLPPIPDGRLALAANVRQTAAALLFTQHPTVTRYMWNGKPVSGFPGGNELRNYPASLLKEYFQGSDLFLRPEPPGALEPQPLAQEQQQLEPNNHALKQAIVNAALINIRLQQQRLDAMNQSMALAAAGQTALQSAFWTPGGVVNPSGVAQLQFVQHSQNALVAAAAAASQTQAGSSPAASWSPAAKVWAQQHQPPAPSSPPRQQPRSFGQHPPAWTTHGQHVLGSDQAAAGHSAWGGFPQQAALLVTGAPPPPPPPPVPAPSAAAAFRSGWYSTPSPSPSPQQPTVQPPHQTATPLPSSSLATRQRASADPDTAYSFIPALTGTRSAAREGQDDPFKVPPPYGTRQPGMDFELSPAALSTRSRKRRAPISGSDEDVSREDVRETSRDGPRRTADGSQLIDGDEGPSGDLRTGTDYGRRACKRSKYFNYNTK